jgi:hypothetical protein
MASPAPSNPTGMTFPDLLLRLAKFRIVWVILVALVFVLVGLLLSGTLELTWDGGALKLSRSDSGQPIAIAGKWKAEGKDIHGVIDNMREPYNYDMDINITQKGSRVAMDGTYRINNHPEDPIRHITGKATLDGEYVSWTYETSINNGASITHGVMFIKVHTSLREASGYYIGRSLKNDGEVFGVIKLHKQVD